MSLLRRVPIGPRDLPILATAVVLVATFAVGAARHERFASWTLVRNLLVDNAFVGIAAVGATFVILAGGIDLSVGALMALTSVAVATMVEHGHVHPLAAIAVALAGGLAFGLLQGALIRAFALPAFLVTLAGMFLARGLAFAISSQSLGITHGFVTDVIGRSLSFRVRLGSAELTVPATVTCASLTFAIAWWTLRYTAFGRATYAIGDDERSATLMGLPVARTRVLVYGVAGFLSALAGVAYTLYVRAGDPAACRGFELDVIAAVVIGGTLLRGGVGSVVGTLMGVLIFGLIQTIIAFEGTLSSWWTRITVGALVLAFVAAQRGLARAGRSLGRLGGA